MAQRASPPLTTLCSRLAWSLQNGGVAVSLRAFSAMAIRGRVQTLGWQHGQRGAVAARGAEFKRSMPGGAAEEGGRRRREKQRKKESERKRKRTRKWWGQRSGGGTSRKRAKQARQGKARKAGGKELEKRVAGEERVPLPRHKTYGAAPLLKTAFQSRLLGRRDTRA